MKSFFIGLLVFILGTAVFAQPGQLQPIVSQGLCRIGGNYDLQSPGLLQANIHGRFSENGWPKYTQPPINGAFTGSYINYSLNIIESAEYSNNGWGLDASCIPFLNRYISGGYSEGRSDARARYLCVLEVWCVLDADQNGGRIEIARGHGGSASTFDFLPYQGYQTNGYIRAAGHSSSGATYTSNPLSLQEDALLRAAVLDTCKNLEQNLASRGFSFQPPKVQYQQPSNQGIAPSGGQYGGPPQATPYHYRLRLTPAQLEGARHAGSIEIHTPLGGGQDLVKLRDIQFRLEGNQAIYDLPFRCGPNDYVRFYNWK